MSKSASTSALALLLICASPHATFGQSQDGLRSPSQEIRDATAEIVRFKFVPTARSKWDPTLDAVRQLVSRDAVVALLQGIGATQEGGMSSGQTSYESFRLDSEWVLRCSFHRTDAGEKLHEAELYELMQHLWVAPPAGFTGLWRTYFVNGHLSHEIEYSGGAYSGVLTTFHSDGSRAVVQHYRNGVAQGDDTGYFPSGAVMYRGRYENNEPVDTWVWYNEDGTVREQQEHRDPRS